jgi:tRNA (cytidine/uridine-2'-O-)-methyltransferase
VNPIAQHSLKLVLVEPEIPQNAGNVARLCAATGAQLHLVRPMGFFLSDKHFKRAGMDYVSRIEITTHDDVAALFREIGGDPLILTTGLADAYAVPHWSVAFSANTWILFGKESAGLPADLLAAHRSRTVRIPMVPEERGLNLATAAGIVLYEALRQLQGGS